MYLGLCGRGGIGERAMPSLMGKSLYAIQAPFKDKSVTC